MLPASLEFKILKKQRKDLKGKVKMITFAFKIYYAYEEKYCKPCNYYTPDICL